MSADNEVTMAEAQNLVLGEVQKNWKWLLFLGIVFLVLGIIGLGRAFALTMASVYFFGFLLLIGGAIQLFESFVDQPRRALSRIVYTPSMSR